MTVTEACRILGVSLPDLRVCNSFVAAAKMLADWQSGPLKKAYKSTARANHPDLGGETEAMQHVNAAYEGLCKIDVQRKPKPRPVPFWSGGITIIRVHSANGASFSGFGSATTSATGDW